MTEKLHINCDAIEAAAARLAADRDKILEALKALENAPRSLDLNYLKRRSAITEAAAAADALERERLFLLESAKRFRGAQTRSVKRCSNL